MGELEIEIKNLIVESLNLEDIVPEEIETEAPLFGEGLGFGEFCLVPANQCEPGAGTTQSQGHGPAEAAARSSDYRRLAI